MREDRLSPELGRLIDAAKAAAGRVDPALAGTEVVAVLTSTGEMYVASADKAGPGSSAAESALTLSQEADGQQVVAAVVALAHDASESVSLSSETSRILAGVDSELPVVIKRLGRWVMLPMSRLDSGG